MPVIQLLDEETATNGAPSAATDGVAVKAICDRAAVVLKSTAGSGTMTVTLKLWGYYDAMAAWAPIGVHATAATKGVLNAGNAIGETGADSLRHAEVVSGLLRASRLYLEVAAIGGTATAVSAWADLVPVGAVTAG